MTDKRFPIQGGFSVTWGDAEKAYKEYKRLYGGSQSLKRLGERGGFGLLEFVRLYSPLWKSESDKMVEHALIRVLRESSLRVELG